MPTLMPISPSLLKSALPRLSTVAALAFILSPSSLLAQDQLAGQERTALEDETTATPIPLVPTEPTWDSFHGQLNAQKYSPLDQINADNVGELEKVWEVHTGDISDGSGDLPATVWSATPVFANDTLYLGTPFYRVLALDPASGEELYDREAYEKADSGSGNESGFAPQEGAPYGIRLEIAQNWLGMPCWEPPFGELVALDMTTGDIKWRRPVGASQQHGFFMPESWGSPTIGGPVVTAGGIIFIGASMDAKVRAYSLETGEQLWSDQVEAPSVSNPAVYEYNGRQYVAFIAGGNTILKDQVSDQIAVYALPE